MDIKDKLKQFRFDNDLSLEEVAKETGVSKSTLARIETGDSNPTKKTIEKIKEVIDPYYPENPSTSIGMMELFFRIMDYPFEVELKGDGVELWNMKTGAGVRMEVDDLVGSTAKAMKAYGDEFFGRFPHLRMDEPT